MDCFDKSLNVLSILPGSISIASFASVIGVPAGIIGASCGFMFSITLGSVKKFLKTIRGKKKKNNKIIMLARSKLNSIESNYIYIYIYIYMYIYIYISIYIYIYIYT